MPTGIHFENEAGDFQNDFRFMVTEIINEKLKSVKFKGANWNVNFTPTLASITRMNYKVRHIQKKLSSQSKPKMMI